MNIKLQHRLITIAITAALSFGMALAMPANAGKMAATGKASVQLKPDEIKWLDGPKSLPAGSKYALLTGNPSKPGLFTMRLKLPANYKIPAHHHLTRENVTVISGNFYFSMGDKFNKNDLKLYPEGSFVSIPTKMNHYVWTGDNEVVVQLNNMGPWEIIYVNSAKDPRKQTP